MKKIVFEKLKIKNFLSVGDKPVEISFKPGLHAITGVNKDQIDRRNGVGKSTIADALYFALFGNTLRELKKEHVINNITGKTVEVSLSFNILKGNEVESYEIVRTLEPSKCFLYHNLRDVTRDSITNTTEYISNLIGATEEVFQNCVIMSINNTVPFMAKKKTEKRKFIEGIFNLEIFSKMLSQLREEQNTVKKDHDTESARLNEVTIMVENLTKQQTKSKLEYEQRKEKLLKRHSENEEEIKQLDSKIKSYKEINVDDITKNINLLNEKLATIDKNSQELSKQVASLETKNEFYLKSIAKIGTKEDVCPVCLKQVTEVDHKHINKTKKEYNVQIKDHESQIKDLEQKISEISIHKTKIMDAIKKGQNNIQVAKLAAQQHITSKNRIIELNNFQTQLKDDLTHLNDTSNELNSIILESNDKITDINKKIENFKQVINLLETSKFVVSEEGVKSYIVKKILQLFNNKLAYYLKKLNSNAIVSFNEYFEEQVLNEKGKFTSYFNFSGAERKVIDLAIMFTFIDMLRLQGNIYYNIQFYDELLDTSLDETGVELVLSLLNEFIGKHGFGIYVISHRKECAKFCNGDIIYLEKKNGITTLSKPE